MDDKNKSYSIYIDRRPSRILYIFNRKKVTIDQVDSIIEYNLGKWGGRYNFILPITGTNISGSQWKFLERYDPDFVNSYIPITRKLAIDFDTKITPLLVTDLSSRVFTPRINDEGLSILPTTNNIWQVSNSFGGEAHIVLFDLDNCTDKTIRSFIERNFGVLNLKELFNEKLLSQYKNKIILKITDKKSLIEALKSFNDFKPYVFPIQLCSIGDYLDDDKTLDDENNFYVFIGDSALDLIDFWNNPIYLKYWTRNRLRQIWLPLSLANDHELLAPLTELIKGRADPYGNGSKKIIFSSRTLSKKKLDLLSVDLTNGTWLLRESKIKVDEVYPSYPNYFSFDRIKSDMVHIRGSGREEKIIIPEPEIQEGVMGGESWMNDLYIQVPEKKVLPVNFETWLQLPRNNSVAQTIISGAVRMTKERIPSALTSRSNQFKPDSQNISIKFPTTGQVFSSIISNSGKPVFTSDARKIHIIPYKYDIFVSSAGKHVRGFLETFGDLDSAYQVLEDRHWRIMFDQMANVAQQDEEKRLNKIKIRLTKQISKMVSNPLKFISSRFIEWLSHELQKTARDYQAANPKAIPFSSIEKIVKKELTEYNSKNSSSKFKYSKEATADELSSLTESGAVLIGYELLCPSCLNREWRALNEVSQILECRGCGHKYAFAPETEIKYKLNSLIENGVRARGVVPVILALGELFHDARHYFDFLPPVDIYKGKKHLTDLDICCVVDGSFIIGEVKARQELFHSDDFSIMTEIAKEIRPNKVVFSSLDETIPQKRKDDVEKVRSELEPYGIKVEWLYLKPWVFEPSPIY